MLKYFTKNTFFLLISLFFLTKCTTSKQQKNLAYKYQKNTNRFTFKNLVHHQSSDSSTIYVQMSAKNLTFDENKETQIQTQIQVYEHIKEGGLLDTFFRNITVKENPSNTNIALWKYLVPIKTEKDYLVVLNMIEKSTGRQFENSFRVWKKAELANENEQNFLCINTTNRQFLFENYANVSSDIIMRYRQEISPTLQVSYFKTSQQLALPPFVTDRKIVVPSKADSSFQIQGNLTLEKEGIYFIQKNKGDKYGKTIVAVSKGFPKLTSAEALTQSLRYITRNQEYQMIINAENTKVAIDKFWMKRAGSPERGKKLIKEFYGRVQSANEYFTNYMEGWQTDAGLIYVIYGEPTAVYDYFGGEEWVYEARGSWPRQSFYFNRVSTPFMQDFLSLERNIQYEERWHLAVYEWRKGMIQNVGR
ncbi:MAG: GWxTD domain-containing protein [Chitinophagales bacterium]